MRKSLLLKFSAAFCAVFAAAGMLVVIFSNIVIGKGEDVAYTAGYVLAAVVLTGMFAFVCAFRTSRRRAERAVLILISAAILILGAVFTPYSPCHDSLDLHNALYNVLNNKEIDTFYRAYMNFWINNKLTVYCYIPFVKLFGSVETGVRVLNGVLNAGAVFFAAGAVKNIVKNSRFERALFIISFLSPFLLMSGPYIYLPALFLAAGAVFFITLNKRAALVPFFICSSLLFILRPTCFGFILVFVTAGAFFKIKDKKDFLKGLIVLFLTIILAFLCKNAVGYTLNKTGTHKYPSMHNGAFLWTTELGTRLNGKKTGTCFYMFFDKDDDFDEIQNDFNGLWLKYYEDEFYKTNKYEEIKEEQKIIGEKILRRTLNAGFADTVKRLSLKTINFYRNMYIPYFYKQNVNSGNFKIWKNYDKKYFDYMNIILLLFFFGAVKNAVRVFKRGADGTVTALILSAVAVNVVLILFTEVAKRYMFDFFTPMVISVAALFADGKERNISRAEKVVLASFFIIFLILFERKCNITPLKNAELTFTRGENVTMTVKMKRACRENYIIECGGERMSIYGKKEFSITFPDDTFDAFSVISPSKSKLEFSSQIIR